MQEKILALCEKGYSSLDRGEAKQALRLFYQAWTLIPRPQYEYEEAGWVLTAIGDAYYHKGEYGPGAEALESALHCKQTADNPVVLKRLGQCFFHLDEEEKALVAFRKAIALGGKQLFTDESPRYLRLVRKAQEPV